MTRLRALRAVLALSAVTALSALSADAQTVQAGLSRDTIRVGDPFRAVVKIGVPPGAQVVLPDSLPTTEDIENAGRMRSQRDSTANGVSVIAAYPLAAWRPGSLTLPNLDVVIKTASGEQKVAVKLPDVPVISVLPQDTSKIEAKPPKDVLGANRLWWPWILLALLLLLALGLGYWLWRRRRNRRETEEMELPLVMPRERALEELERIRKMGLANEGMYKRHYSLVSEVLRRYMETVDPEWIGGLTTDELARKIRGNADAMPAVHILRNADVVKFANAPSTAAEAMRDLDSTRDWISSYPPPPPVAAEEKAA